MWPSELRKDVRASNNGDADNPSGVAVDRKRVYDMLKPATYPDEFPKLLKMEAMKNAAKNIILPDLEDLGEVFQK